LGTDADPIVVGVDGSTSTRSTLRWAAHEARSRGVALVAVHAWERHDSRQGVVRMARNAWALLDRILANSADDLIGVEVRRVVEQGDPAAILVDEAAKGAMLVIGSSRPSEVTSLMGSVAWWCARCAAGPIVLVPDQSTASQSADPSGRAGRSDMTPCHAREDSRGPSRATRRPRRSSALARAPEVAASFSSIS
jgi:nucleotide-binding universal stress UspA family protein